MLITEADIRAMSRTAAARIVQGIVENQHFIAQGGIDTPLRLCHFMAQLAYESAHFGVTRGFASGEAYEGRRDLGNMQPGDGRRYRDRGLIQTTGRANYREASDDIRCIIPDAPDFEADPVKLEEFPWALLAGISYWRRRNINRYADRDDIIAVTRAINGGQNGLDDRKQYLLKAKAIWMAERTTTGRKPTVRKGDKGEAVVDLQNALIEAGYRLSADGDFGAHTEEVVIGFQLWHGLESDGIVGPTTWAALRGESVIADEATPSREILVTGHTPSGELVTSFKPETSYALRFRVAARSDGNLAEGDVDVTSVPATGLAARWIVASTSVEFLAVSPAGTIVKRGDTYVAEFDLAIPGQGDSATVTLNVRTTRVSGELMLTLLVAGEEYRKLTVSLGFGAHVKEDIVCTAPGHLNLWTTHEWTTPPEHIAVNVMAQAARVTTIRGPNDYGTVDWTGNSTTLKNPIERVRRALEKFRVTAEAHLDNLDVTDMERRLHQENWKPFPDKWVQCLPYNADPAHHQELTALASGTELRALANEGYRLFDTCFPPGSDLRGIIEKLEPGSRLDFVWTSRGAVDWVSHVPWALMYLAPLKSSEPVNCECFLGLRYRIGSKSWEPKAPSRALGDPATVNVLHFLYWGNDPKDEVGVQALWQRNEFGKWPRQNFVPDPNRNDPKQQVVTALETPQPEPAGILYFYCHCSVKDGSDPVLQFGETSKTPDIVEASDIYPGHLETGPLVFANACTTAAADPQGTSELESRFFARDIRAFLGTETKVPVTLASRFAWLFFQFFLRQADPKPMSAGEALAQARHFLWTQYLNPGGLFYCLVNQYDLCLESHAEMEQRQRK